MASSSSSFSRLRFYEASGGRLGPRAEAFVFFPNRYGAMVWQEEHGRGDDTYAVSVLEALRPHPKGQLGVDSQITYDTSVTDHSVGNLDRDGVERMLREIAALPTPSIILSERARNFREWIEDVVLRAGEGEIDASPDADTVCVAIVVDVTAYTGNSGSIYASQDQSEDKVLQEAYDILETYERERMSKEEWARLEKEAEASNMDPDELMTETYQGKSWALTPEEFEWAIHGSTRVAQFVDTYDSRED